jgi:hypothetical protein
MSIPVPLWLSNVDKIHPVPSRPVLSHPNIGRPRSLWTEPLLCNSLLQQIMLYEYQYFEFLGLGIIRVEPDQFGLASSEATARAFPTWNAIL